MPNNKFSYRVFEPADYASMIGWGFTGYNESADGNYRVADRASPDPFTGGNISFSEPSYATGLFSNFPHLTRSEVITLRAFLATTETGSDGWTWNEP